MVKRLPRIGLAALVVTLLCAGCSRSHGALSSAALERGFAMPSDSMRISTYWYWISGNISREGVVADLKAMKEAGITRAFIGNIGHEDVPAGPVKLMSDEWWEILRTTLKTASELDIEIGIFNSPGWSQSGGPWVRPEQSMRYLASSELPVSGPIALNVKLPIPPGMIRDVRVIAYPEPKDEGKVLNAKTGRLRTIPAFADAARLADGDTLTGIALPAGAVTIEFESDSPFTARSLTLRPEHRPLIAQARLEADGGSGFQTVRAFDVSRYNEMPNVGFDVYAPVTVSFAGVTARKFRIVLDHTSPGAGLREVELSAAPRLERYSEKSLAKMHQTPLPYWKDYMWPDVAAVDDPATVVDPAVVVDLTRNMASDGTLTWDVPPGRWVIQRTGMASTGVKNSPATPEATGLEIDKMSREHVRSHFDAFIGQILERIPASDRRTFKVVVQDSYETGGQNFTDGFLEKFSDRYAYDATPYLPVFEGRIVGSAETSDRFLWDVRRMVADAVSYDYVGGMRDVAHEHGLTTWLENYGHWGFPGEFLQYGGQSDEVAGEFWSEGELGDIENRAASSCAHIYGKQKVYAESFTCAGLAYSRYPAVMKQRCDRFFAEGINSTLITLFVSQPDDRLPGVNAAYGNEFNRNNTWFPLVGTFVDYLKRCNFMLQQGLNVADVAYFIGEDAPKMTGVADPALPAGYQFDYINGEVLRDRATVSDGLLTLPHGTQYRLLVLPRQQTMRPELLEKLALLVRDGAVVLGPRPERSPSGQGQPEADERVRTLAAEMWGDSDGKNIRSHRYGKGLVLSGMTMEEALALLDCPPDMQAGTTDIHYGHRRAGDIDIYFLSNQTSRPAEFTAAFRVKSMQPELWEPVSGAIRDLPRFDRTDRTTAVPMRLEPFESAFVVFRRPAKQQAGTGENYSLLTETAVPDGPWSVTFDPAYRGPAAPVATNSLFDWSCSASDSIRYYSGTARYATTFTMKPFTESERVYLDLGGLTAIGRVNVNGHDAGGVWTPPYRAEITDWVSVGENRLEVEVANTWVNRLIGDSRLPEGERPTWSPHNPWTPLSPLQPSGLFGPVRVLVEK